MGNLKKNGFGEGGLHPAQTMDLQVVNKIQHNEVFFHETYQE